ncbi:MAG: hypothetical protein WCY28_02290 [Candidatus Shapirobacteria bacterium]
MVSPEGHRNEDGNLGKTSIVSVGISFNKNFNRSKSNVGKSLDLTVSKPYLNKKGDNIDFYMNKLTETLPKKMRGKWN